MRFPWLLAVPLLALPNPGRASPVPLPTRVQGLLCRAAVAAAERNSGIPPHLLAAISRVESGRRDPVTGDWHPWPWTLDIEGEGSFYETKAQAVAAIQAAQARGVQSIDVGCAQINLLHHPNAFASLDIALDPQANANYAAQFLKELYGQSGDWNKAAAAYHSATPEIGAEYQRKVLAVWPEETRLRRRILAVGIATVPILGRDTDDCFIWQRSSAARPDIGHGRASENDHATSPNWRNSPRGAQPGRLPVGADRTRVPTADTENRAVISNSGAVPGHAPRCRTESGWC